MTPRLPFPSLVLGSFAVATSLAAAADTAFPPEQIEFFEKSVRPVLADRCYDCHGAHKHQNGLRLDSRDAVIRGSDYGKVVEPGNPSASKLIKAVTHAAGVEPMPKKGDKLTATEIAALEKWITMGLPWPKEAAVAAAHSEKADPKQHWAFQPVKADRSKSIDELVGAKLKAVGLDFALKADNRTLTRRLYLTLTGLPPTKDQSDQSNLTDLISKLLSKPAYGERWARVWLDVVRYADTNGYQVAGRSNFYPYAYTYRDWVVKAFNDDMPYDQFVSYQLAADRMTTSAPNSPHLAALGLYNVGERFINDRLLINDDRIDVIGRGLLGLTVACARCHDHKFDPIPSRDYYAFYSIINSSEELDDPQMPVIGKAANEKDAQDYEAKVAAIDAKTLEFKRKVHAESIDTNMLPQYLVFAQEAQAMDSTAFRGKAGQLKLRDRVADMWRDFIKKHTLTGKPHSVMLAWKEFAAIPAAEFEKKAPEVSKRLTDPASGLNAVLRNELPKRTLRNLNEVAMLYRDAFVAALSGKEPDNAEWRQVRELLQSNLSPFSITPEKADTFFTRKDRESVVRIENERTKLDATHPGAPPRAMVMLDKPKPNDVRIYMRGNPARQGDPAPRAWLTMFGGEKFTNGSGRLELAQKITSKDNPLTARVIVNRVWMQHFGKPLVSQPSDFGVQTPQPAQADLLDFLADYLMQNGWSLKKLQTLILSSRTWQQSSHASPEKLLKDAENELLSRFNRQRLDYETMRDCILAATGELDTSKQGGRAIELNAKDADTRRTLYLKVDRYDQATVPAMFDFANPDGHSPQRFNTTVPQQALFLMNSPFMRTRADAVSKATQLQGSSLDSEALRSMYQRILARDPRPDEVELAQRFMADATVLDAEKPFRWSYGTVTLTRTADGKPAFNGFEPFKHLTERANGGQRLWSPSEKIPSADPQWGHAFWANYGGHAAPKDHVVAARWHVPSDLQITIDATLSRKTDRGDGVRAWIHNSRTGVLSEYLCNPQNKQLPTQLTTDVRKGDVLSFLVHNEASTDSDSFEWQPRITRADTAELLTDAKADFCDASRWPFGRAKPQSPLSQLAQVLLISNEFMFLD